MSRACKYCDAYERAITLTFRATYLCTPSGDRPLWVWHEDAANDDAARVLFDKLRREAKRQPLEDIRLAINAEINAGKAARRAKTEAEGRIAMAKEKVAEEVG
jgi:hypothetical protein